MNEYETKSLIFVCPYHGRIGHKHSTTMKTCGKCMEEIPCDAARATTLRREPFQEHAPRWQYDCARCKFAWCCGPQCACHIKGKMPEARKKEVAYAVKLYNDRIKK